MSSVGSAKALRGMNGTPHSMMINNPNAHFLHRDALM
jgi:hypothetical protein